MRRKTGFGDIVLYILLFAASFISGMILTELPHRSIATETVVQEEAVYTPTAAEMTGDKININAATDRTLQTLSGIGEKLAQRIVDYRTENGAFRSIENLMDVSGIGKDVFDRIKDKICVE